MHDLPNGRFVFAVAQLPFETESRESAAVNMFATLAPVLDDRGRQVDSRAFPNSGLAWWMLRSGARSFAEPGRLVSAYVEQAIRFDSDDPDSHYYQVDVQSVEPVRPDLALDVLSVSSTVVEQPRDLINRSTVCELERPATDLILVRWRDRIYGPFRSSSTRRSETQYEVGLALPTGESSVISIPQNALLEIGDGYAKFKTCEISYDSQPLARTQRKRHVTYELVTGAGLESLRRRPHDVLPLTRDVDLFKRAAKELMSRRDRQELGRLLDRLAGEIRITEDPKPDLLALVERTSEQLKADDAASRELAEALVASGTLDDALAKQVDERAIKYVEDNAARLRADIAAKIEDTEAKLRVLRDERDRLTTEVDDRRRQASAGLEHELALLRESHEVRLQEEWRALEQERGELLRQREVVAKHLDLVSARYESARDSVLQDFSAMWPLFQRVTGAAMYDGTPASARMTSDAGTAAEGGARGRPTSGDPVDRPNEASTQPLVFPSFVYADAGDTASLAEDAFLDRLRSHTKARGLAYRDLDLLGFHLSVKCGNLTILGGVSGTGKSTLPRLYAEALAGSEVDSVREEEQGRYLHVAVRPSWLDQQDLLGHVNGLEKRFVPSESGLYRLAICAQEEQGRRGAASGVYLACLDEMNLSHVEHYFGGFLQALERDEGLRLVRVFDIDAVDAADPFRRWNTLNLSQALRFVGTVNYDETTKPLSLRLLDRANVLELTTSGGYDFGLLPAERERALPGGAPVNARAYRSWVHDRSLERRFAETLDRMRGPLLSLNCPITPRRYRAISRFVSSANGLLTQESAFDLQICQRVLPQVRNVYGSGGREALEELTRIVDVDGALPEASRVVRTVAERELGAAFG